MYQTVRPTIELQVSDLVLDPLMYNDALGGQLREGWLDSDATEHLAKLLPRAVAQLDALGDVYGALALAGLLDQISRLATLV